MEPMDDPVEQHSDALYAFLNKGSELDVFRFLSLIALRVRESFRREALLWEADVDSLDSAAALMGPHHSLEARQRSLCAFYDTLAGCLSRKHARDALHIELTNRTRMINKAASQAAVYGDHSNGKNKSVLADLANLPIAALRKEDRMAEREAQGQWVRKNWTTPRAPVTQDTLSSVEDYLSSGFLLDWVSPRGAPLPFYEATLTNPPPGNPRATQSVPMTNPPQSGGPRDVRNEEIRLFMETAPLYLKRLFAWRCLHQGARFLRGLIAYPGTPEDVLRKFSDFEAVPTPEGLMAVYRAILDHRDWGVSSFALTDVIQAFQRACEDWDYSLRLKSQPGLAAVSDPGHVANMIVQLIVPRVTPAVEVLLCDWIRETRKTHRAAEMMSRVDDALEHLSLED